MHPTDMKKKSGLYILALTLTSLATNNYAGNTKTYGTSTRAQSMGGAFVAIADDASAVYYNPAGLTQIKNLGILMNLSPITQSTTYNSSITHTKANNKRAVVGNSTFMAKRLNDNIVVGFGAYAPFARATSYPATSAILGSRIKTQILDVNMTPVVAFNATKRLSLGLGPTLSFDYLSANVLGLKQKATGYAVSGVLSAMYVINQMWKVGATLHAPTSIRMRGKGNGTYFGTPILDKFIVKYRNPAYLDIGTSTQITEKLLVGLGVGWEYWAHSRNARFLYDSPLMSNTLTFNPKNSYTAHAGLEYQVKQDQNVRLGYAFYEQALPDEAVNPGVLDFNTHVFSAGYSYLYHKVWRFDFGYEYAMGSKPISTLGLYNPFLGRYQGIMNSFLLGINYQV